MTCNKIPHLVSQRNFYKSPAFKVLSFLRISKSFSKRTVFVIERRVIFIVLISTTLNNVYVISVGLIHTYLKPIETNRLTLTFS